MLAESRKTLISNKRPGFRGACLPLAVTLALTVTGGALAQSGNLFAPVGGGNSSQGATAPTTRGLTPESKEKLARVVEKTIDTDLVLELVKGRPKVIVLKSPPLRFQIPDEELVSVTAITEKEISVTGLKTGTSTLNIWLPAQDGGSPTVLSYLVRVSADPASASALASSIKILESQVNGVFTSSSIELTLVGDNMVVKGQARDIYEAARILRLIESQAPVEFKDVPFEAKGMSINLENPRPEDLPAIREYLSAGGRKVINMITIPGEQQIMLRVTIAEVNRAASRSLGVNWSFTDNEGDFSIGNKTGNIGVGNTNIPISYSGEYPFQAAIRAMRNLNFAKSLAEPNLVTMNGKEASFRTGGSFPVPVVTGNTSSGLQGVQFQDFGVSLRFTPFVMDKDRIRLAINTEVSTRDGSGGASVGGTTIPGLDSRNFDSTVEMREGQTLAIAGILQTSYKGATARLPLLGDLPLIGPLMGNNEAANTEQELVVLVTPQFVRPLEATEIPTLPGQDAYEPDDLEFYLYGRLESRAPLDFRSAAMNDFDRLRHHRLNQVFISGPSGYAPDRIEN